MTRTLLASLVVLACSCKTTPKQEAEPKTAVAPTVVTDAPPPQPKVELAAAHELPKAPVGLPEVNAPVDNPITAEKADLGWKLFFDPRLSKDGSMACVNCHHIDKAYTSGLAVDPKVGGAMNKRNAPTMVNLAFHTTFYWDGRMPTLEAVSNAAWKGQLGADPSTVVAALNAVPVYKATFERAFGEPATVDNVPKALATWLRTLESGHSAWDQAQAKEKPLSADAAAGEKVFTAKGCVTCHVPPLFTTYEFENAGIGDDTGRKDATKADEDAGKFKIPSLRNVALTAPYFHDGSVAALDDAIALMAKGNAKNPKLKAQKLSAKEAKALKAFLESLTGESTWTEAPALP